MDKRIVDATLKPIINEFGDPAVKVSCSICRQHLTTGNRSWPKSDTSPVVFMLRPVYHLAGNVWKPARQQTGPGDAWRGSGLVIRNEADHDRHMAEAAQDYDAGDVVLIECPQCGRHNRIDTALATA